MSEDGLRNVSTLAGLLAISLADAGVVPLRLMPSVHQLQMHVHRLVKSFSRLIPNNTLGNIFLSFLVGFISNNNCFADLNMYVHKNEIK